MIAVPLMSATLAASTAPCPPEELRDGRVGTVVHVRNQRDRDAIDQLRGEQALRSAAVPPDG